MSPEQAQGRIEELDERADVFALGAILCEILTGKPPFVDGDVDSLLLAARADLAEAERRLAACGEDDALVALCRACLSPAREARPADGGAVARAVAGYLIGIGRRAHRARLAAVGERAAADRARIGAEEARVAARQQRRRRQQAMLAAATILVAVLAGGGGWLWHQHERTTQQRRIAAVVDQALDEAASRKGAGDWVHALASAQRACDLAARDDATPELRAQALALRNEIREAETAQQEAAARADETVALRAHLEILRLRCAETEPADIVRLDAAFAEAFRRAGTDAPELAGALDEWAALRLRSPQLRDRDWRAPLLAASEADAGAPPELTEAVVARDVDALLRLAGGDADAWPARAVDRLGLVLAALGEHDAAADVLRRALWSHPGDFWLRCHLADLCLSCEPPRATEACSHYTAALALRPRCACVMSRLAEARRQAGDYEAALVAHRRAVELEPAHAVHECRLGAELEAMGYLDGAVAALRRAVEADAASATAHRLLGVALAGAGDRAGARAMLDRARLLREDDPETLFRLGGLLLGSGRPAEAAAALRRSTELDPSAAKAHANLGVAWLRMGELERARAALQRSVALAPRFARAHYNLAVVHHASGDPALAVRALHTALALRSRWHDAHAWTDVALADEGTLDAALRIAEEAAARSPEDVRALCDLAIVHRLRGSPGAAADACRRAAALDPGSALPWIGLGQALVGAEALDAFRRALALAPDDAAVHAGIGCVLLQTGRSEEAESALRRALELDPGDATVHARLGSALARQGRGDAAWQHLEQCLQLAARRTDPKALDRLGVDLLKADAGGREAARALHVALRSAPRSAVWHAALGRELSHRREMQRALECYRHALDLDPRNATALEGMGWVYCEWLHDYEQGIRYYESAIHLAPDDPGLRTNLAWGLWGAHDYRAAEAAFRAAIERGPRSYLVYYWLGRMLLLCDDPAGAESVLREGLRDWPHERVRIVLAQALDAQGRTGEAIAEARRAVAQAPDDIYVVMLLAGLLCDGTQPEHRRPQEAVVYARRAARAWPNDWTADTLARALYRAGQYEEALAIDRGRRLTGAGGAERGLRTAIAYAKLGRTTQARACLARALAELARRPSPSEGTRQLLDEARALIGSDG